MSRRLARVAAAAALTLSACARQTAEECPGVPLVTLELRGTLPAGATGCVAPPTGGWVVPATIPNRAPTLADPVPTFRASFHEDPGSDRIAYCTGHPQAAVLRGTRTGDHLRVETTLPGAVLGACAPTCRPLATEVVEGDLVPGQAGGPATFTGTFTETFDDGEGPCGACVLPCTSQYALTGTEE